MNSTWLVGAAVAAVAMMSLACSDDGGTSSSNTTSSSSSSSSVGGTGGDAGAGGDAGGAGGGSGGQGGMGEELINDCLSTIADDETDQVQVVFNWTNPHHRCVLVTTETQVGWQGDFMLHPLAGGKVVNGMGDEVVGSQISMLDQSGVQTGTVFMTEGVYPYFCKNHAGTMNGTIYVQPAAGAGGAGGSM